jgi:probable phosphomutase (TIGR03848 family)
MRPLAIADVVSSPMDRCLQTARAATGREPHIDERLTECDYGDWTGKALTELRADPLWQVVQTRPSAMVFPGGEALRDVSHRAVSAVREHDQRVDAEHGEHARWVTVTHSDVIKCIVADALGIHLDLFQRIVIDTCSVTTISYSENGPFVVGLNLRDLAERDARVEE